MSINVAIFGGSFDPPHLGHLRNVLDVIIHPEIDLVQVVVCFQQSGKNLTDFTHRFVMGQLTFGAYPQVQVNDLEARLGGESLTLRTLEALRDEHPDWKMRFVLGEDLVESFKSWDGTEKIQKLAPPIVMRRDDYCSSSLIRSLVSNKNWTQASKYLVPAVTVYLQSQPLLYAK